MAFQLCPPLVSVIISNYNYERFVRDAVESVRTQTYTHIECIVVDDCSTDESWPVIEALGREWPDLTIIKMAVNSGQSAVSLEGLAAAHGEFVLFLDADDVLFPECVRTHLALHMSSRRPVGFTCCDSMQIVDGRLTAARWGPFSAGFMRLPADPLLTSDTALANLAAQGIDLPAIAAEKVRHVPWTNTGWPWTTTSSMFFRKAALDMVSGASGLRTLRIATDNFLAHAVNHLTGSLLLDEQLVGYRLHGANNFNRRAALDGFLGHDRKDEHYDKTRRVILDDLMTRFPHYAANMEDPHRIFRICRLIDVPNDEPGLPRWAARSRFERLKAEHRDLWQPILEEETALRPRLLRRLASPWRRLRGRAGRSPSGAGAVRGPRVGSLGVPER